MILFLSLYPFLEAIRSICGSRVKPNLAEFITQNIAIPFSGSHFYWLTLTLKQLLVASKSLLWFFKAQSSEVFCQNFSWYMCSISLTKSFRNRKSSELSYPFPPLRFYSWKKFLLLFIFSIIISFFKKIVQSLQFLSPVGLDPIRYFLVMQEVGHWSLFTEIQETLSIQEYVNFRG